MTYKNFDKKAVCYINKWIKDFDFIGAALSYYPFISWFQNVEYAIVTNDEGKDTLYLRATSKNGKHINWKPLTYGKFEEAIKLIPEDETIYFCTCNDLKTIDTNEYYCKSYRAADEYIYDSKNFADMIGKKYHAKRNHVSKFIKLYPSAQLVPYEKSYYDLVLSFATQWIQEKEVSQDFLVNYSLDAEFDVLKGMLNGVEEGKLICNLLLVDNKIVGITIAEILPSNTAIVMYEKADIHYEGSYTYLAKNFAKQNLYDCKYINRQEDMGLDGLRQSKLSYNPEFLLTYYAIIKKEYQDHCGSEFSETDITKIKDGYVIVDDDYFNEVMSFLEEQRNSLSDKKFFLNYTDDELHFILSHGFMYAHVIDGKIVATCGVDSDREFGNKLKEICHGLEKEGQYFEFSGIMVHEDFRGQGLGRDICMRVIDWANEHVAPCTLCAVVYYTNTPSLDNLKKLGFIERAQEKYQDYEFKYLTRQLGAK